MPGIFPVFKCMLPTFPTGHCANWMQIWRQIECVRSCDQKLYLLNETKGWICIKIEFNPQRVFHSSNCNMDAVSLFTAPTWPPWRHVKWLAAEGTRVLSRSRERTLGTWLGWIVPRAGQGALFPAGEFYLYSQKEN